MGLVSDTFAGLLRRHRRAARLSQEALAEGAALSKDAVSALERGARRAPYRDTVELLARALRLDEPGRREFEEAAARGRAHRLHFGDGIRPSNLPQMGTMLVGRDDAVDSLLALLEEHPIVTIVGPGGIGKTRVALDAGERFVHAHRTSAWFCDLAAVSHDAPIAAKIASSTGVTGLGSDEPIDEIPRLLHSFEGLLILDNCEHVIAQAARVAASIAAGCPKLKVLATSRERLTVRCEHVYNLGPLEGDAARELFRVRASSAGLALKMSDKDVVDEICSRVDNIPLAIELAAARAPLFGLTELRRRLKGELAMLSGGDRNAPSRQRAMNATIGWSYDLLGQNERTLFRRLAVFAGGWNLAALEPVVAGSSVARELLLPAFTSLVQKSLVTADLEADPVRYRLLEPIRAFALARLREAGELERCRERHARWMAGLAESFAQSEEQHYSLEEIGSMVRELDNARAAIEWSLQPDGDAVLGARIAGAMRTSMLTMGLTAESRRWCESILARLDHESDASAAARVFRALIPALNGRRQEQSNVTAQAMPVYERAGDWTALIEAMSLIALRYAEDGRFDDAEQLFRRVDEVREQHCPDPSVDSITVMIHRAIALQLMKRLDEAAAHLDEAVALARKLQRPLQEMWALGFAAEVSFELGRREKAIAIETDILAKNQKYRHLTIEVYARSNLAGYYLAGGDAQRAREEARLAIARGSNQEGYVVVAPVLHLAAAAAVSGNPREAARLRGYCEARYGELTLMKDPAEASSSAILAAALEARLSGDEITDLSRDGAELTDATAIELALSL